MSNAETQKNNKALPCKLFGKGDVPVSLLVPGSSVFVMKKICEIRASGDFSTNSGQKCVLNIASKVLENLS